ncbi:MAG: DUF429 domain-containing protein [Myxococcota bacterium]
MSRGPEGPTRVVGLDVATQPRNVGVALCQASAKKVVVESVALGESWAQIDEEVARFVEDSALVALDAPLGWPATMTSALAHHRAGQGVQGTPNAVFRRRTDDVVAEALGKRPLDVGADRIARTAHAALAFLARLRGARGLAVPLAWQAGTAEGVSAIEVYPAGTLAARGLPSSGYKGATVKAASARRAIIDGLGGQVHAEASTFERMEESDHVLDAVLCAVAAFDFLEGETIEPDDRELAEREGWIWVRRP